MIEAIVDDGLAASDCGPFIGEVTLLVAELHPPQRRMASPKDFIGEGIDRILGFRGAHWLFGLPMDRLREGRWH